ncbi:hypothetical protein HOLleu_16226 [Holothuria leucospilota]|uniref:Uncharacterized protein n=1 Tax=Holothuria leucospilota TaxID=206669 RepID=A0A9Q1C5R5_HOLLE|nr:hypothetical protein HOLleu_16226 [Holothuria leucospilota]
MVLKLSELSQIFRKLSKFSRASRAPNLTSVISLLSIIPGSNSRRSTVTKVEECLRILSKRLAL